MTPLPDWLVERAALDEVPPASRDRIDRADPRELAERVDALRADNAAELAAHPVDPAVAEVEARGAAARRATRPPRRMGWLGAMTAAAAIVVAVVVWARSGTGTQGGVQIDDEGTRVKGSARLLAFRQAGDRVEQLDEDALVHAGDLLQLRYNAGGQKYGVIASVDGAGVVTLHYPAAEDAPTALAAKTTTLPQAYALDDAPRFERFVFITCDDPIDVAQSLAALRALASRPDSATAAAELPAGQRQWSLRLRKPTDSKAPSP